MLSVYLLIYKFIQHLVLYPCVILEIHTVDDGVVPVFSCFMFFRVRIPHASQHEFT